MKQRSNERVVGIVLPAGGARAAYQVGVLKYIGERFCQLEPKIFTGISAGSINACYLAQGDPFTRSTATLYELWARLDFPMVFKTNFRSLFRMGIRWLSDLFFSKVTGKLLLKSLLDASPLAFTLLSHIHFWKMSRAVRQGKVLGIAISATNYTEGQTTVFFDSTEVIAPWKRESRVSIRTPVRAKHVIASCSIPILFEPVRIGDALYGDGSLRFNFPFSPAIHLGATDILAIGIRCPTPRIPERGWRADEVGLGFVAGAVLNSIFLDSIEADFENLQKFNESAKKFGHETIRALLLRPSEDLGWIAKDFLNSVPFHFRQLLKSTSSPEELGDLLSYLMFSPPYIKALLELGYQDAKAQDAVLTEFFGGA